MLGDLHFPLELPSNEVVPPQGCTPWPRARSEHDGLIQPGCTQLRKRTTSAISPVVHRRPVPMGALNDSSLLFHELPPSLEVDAANRVMKKTEDTVRSSESGPSAVKLPLQNTQRSAPYNGPFTYTRGGSDSGADSSLASIAHYSKPPPMRPVFSQQAAAFSADSTSFWGLDTQPKATKALTSSEPVAATRMQSQRQILELLGSIET